MYFRQKGCGPLGQQRIFVVDDTVFMATVITKVLQSANYLVTAFYSGEELLEALKKEKPDIILLDVVMTGISGYEVLDILRQDSRYNLIPILMLTGQSEEEDKLKGLEMGADDYIVKPFNNRELLARVKNTLVRLERSKGANPLTGLRGNNDIEMELTARITQGRHFAVLYLDLNSFKPYNDIYGFANGDLAIKLTADIISDCAAEHGSQTDFIGHIGGDDFIVITEPDSAILIAQAIIDRFDSEILSLYTPDDREKGYIVAKDRSGEEKQFGFIGISAAIVFSEQHPVTNTLDLAEVAAGLKKQAKAPGKSAYAY